ncbi:MAG: hypothetical protein V7L27_08815 [Nostoc sp.]|uniref:hypothetical protein n=1 Tax=Nostoc sp. TaxID=1180 RepID=UPI002FF9EDF7
MKQSSNHFGLGDRFTPLSLGLLATILGFRDAINRRLYKCFVAHSELYCVT